MRLLIADIFAESALDFALRCQADGHDVVWSSMPGERPERVGKGLVKRVNDFRAWMRWADLVFMPDNVKYVKEIDGWRKEGIKIVGPNPAGAAWELDRKLGMEVLKKAGIECPAYKEFNDYDKAIAYVNKEGRAFVSKPCGEETDKSLSYVSKSPADLVYMLERWKAAGKLKGSFLLQEKVDGIEMAVGGWFGPGGWMEGWEVNWEFKKFMAGDIGPNTGEMGTVMCYKKKSPLADQLLKPLTAQLEKIGYVGCIDVNAIIDESGQPWPLEFTCRPGWPAFNIQQALTKGDHAQWLLDLIEGRAGHPFVYDTVAVGVVVAIGDFPHSHATQKEVVGVPIWGVTPALTEHVHPCQVMMGEVPMDTARGVAKMPGWVTAGDYVMVVTGTGETVSIAAKAAYQHLKHVKMPTSPMYRDDIGRRLKRQLPVLKSLGYDHGIDY